MIYQKRTYSLKVLKSLDELLELLRFKVHPLCTGFTFNNLYFFNDSSNEKSYQEYAVFIFENDSWIMVDTLTVSQMKLEALKQDILKLLEGKYTFTVPFSLKVDFDNHNCDLC